MNKIVYLIIALSLVGSGYSQSAKSFYERGENLFDVKQYKLAIDMFTKAIEIDSNYSDAHRERGRAKINLNDPSGAIVDLYKAIEINPMDSKAFNNRGTLYATIGRGYEAINNFTMAIEVDPKNSSAYYNRGLVKLTLKQKDSGCEDLRTASRLGFNCYQAISNYCNY